MEDLDKLFFMPKQAIEMNSDSIVVIDTNVLLSGYQWKDVTITEMIRVLKTLDKQKRLRIPHHAIKEFFNNRPRLILNILREINDIESQIGFHKKPLIQVAPVFSNNDTFKPVFELEKEVKGKIGEYKAKLEEAKRNLLDLFESDHILDEYKNIFKSAYFIPEGYNEVKLIADFTERCKKRIPPGYKDAGKEENSHGDYIIWDSILSLGKKGNDVLFVSCETKNDWVYCDPKGQVISARRELIEEFYEITKGKTFRFITPNDFILLFKPDISDDVKEDLKTTVKPYIYSSSIITNYQKYVERTNETYREMADKIDNLTEPLRKMTEQINRVTEPLREIETNLQKSFCFHCGEDTFWNGVICTKCGYKEFD